MGGRLVCFTDSEGQCGTCIREDEDCFSCNDAKRMIQGVHSGELSYAAAMKVVRAEQHDKELLMEFVNYIWSELRRRGIVPPKFDHVVDHVVDRQGMNVLIGNFLVDRKNPAPRVNYGKHPERVLEPYYRKHEIPPYFEVSHEMKLEDYVDFCYGFLSPVCGFCEVEPSVEHCTKCDVFLRQI